MGFETNVLNVSFICFFILAILIQRGNIDLLKLRAYSILAGPCIHLDGT